MPWKASSVMEERLRFVARLLDGEATTDVCREFGVSRKTGYKTFDRYKEHGLEALSDRSRRPARSEMATTLIAQIVQFARPNIQIYDAHVVDLYQRVSARYLVGVKGAETKAKRS
jgi:transposase